MLLVKTLKNATVVYDNESGYVVYESVKIKGEPDYQGVAVIGKTQNDVLLIGYHIDVTHSNGFNIIKLNKGFMYMMHNKPCFIGSITLYKQ